MVSIFIQVGYFYLQFLPSYSNNRNKLFHQLIILNKFSGKLKLIYQKHMMTKKLKIYWNVNDNLGNEFVWDVDEDSLFFLIEG